MKTLIELITGPSGQLLALKFSIAALILFNLHDNWAIAIAVAVAVWLIERLSYQNGLTDGIVIVSKLNDSERKKLKEAIEEIESE